MKEEVGINMKRNMNSSFLEFILKPRIAVKSFAKVNCSKKPQQGEKVFKFKGKTQECDLLQNLEVVIDDVARGDDNPIGDVTKNYISKRSQQKKIEAIKRLYYCPVTNDSNTDISITLMPTQEDVQHDPLKEPVNESVYCDLCNETFKNSVDFCLHSIKHNDKNKYYCHACKYSSASVKSIEKHVAAHERKTLYNCEICKKGFTSKANAAAHQNVHTGEKPFVCDLCGRGFGSASVFSNHRRFIHWKVLGLTPFKYDCDVCNKSFKGSTCRDRHVKRHHTQDFDESELCDVCGKRLSNKEKLKFHKRTHTGYKPFPCSVCEKRFPRKEQLKEHMRVHSGEKPYKCRYCSKGFTQRSSLRIHERIHTGERPYVCHLCNKGFTSKGVLDLHLKRCEGLSDDSD